MPHEFYHMDNLNPFNRSTDMSTRSFVRQKIIQLSGFSTIVTSLSRENLSFFLYFIQRMINFICRQSICINFNINRCFHIFASISFSTSSGSVAEKTSSYARLEAFLNNCLYLFNKAHI